MPSQCVSEFHLERRERRAVHVTTGLDDNGDLIFNDRPGRRRP
jgi:hypothetical protein